MLGRSRLKEEVEASLLRVAESRAFARATRLRRFLEHVVRERLEGRADRLSGYSIGIDVFDRPEDFDPTTDTIVRVEARRLRQTLELYYANEGQNDPVVLSLPRGGYVPEFSERKTSNAANDSAAQPARQSRYSLNTRPAVPRRAS